MALNWKINVASPVLTQGMSFQVRYRKLNTQNWNNLLPNPTTNEFIIYNLDNGDYEAEIRTVCSNGDLSNPVYHSTETIQNPISATITWIDGTKITKTGNESSIIALVDDLDFNSGDPLVVQQWEKWNGSTFVFHAANIGNQTTFEISTGLNIFRLKIQSQSGQISYSNVLEYQQSNPDIFITDFNYNINAGTSTYKLHVQNQPFVGYANMMAYKQENTRNARAVDNNFGGSLLIPNTTAANEQVFMSTAVNIAVGVYDCSMYASCIPVDLDLPSGVDGSIAFGLTSNYSDSIATTQAGVILEMPGDSSPEV